MLELSALRALGLEAFWAAVSEFRRLQSADGRLAARRQQQALAWMWERVQAGLQQALHRNPAVQQILEPTTRAVADGSLAASVAARRLLSAYESHTVDASHTVRAEPFDKLRANGDLIIPTL